MPDLTLNINGKDLKVSSPNDEPLLSVLRNRLDLTGTKYGCGEGQCGACTVLINGRAMRSCLTPVSAAVGKKIVTVEGLAADGKLTKVQQAFVDEEAFQCAYCTSGMVMAATALLAINAKPSEEEIIRHMEGNVCRCGTYPRIIAAIQRAAGGAR
ncbi:(2Fe-2S)-binding protein [Candidatus Koribacter versatilis Ellin345]|uniref:(2Fe-2S)-binding protein n=1 Tax=Koribacter versatilis (strain Ellin345) TaxID=204669 RepID=Q1IQB8_KORVE|nr:(2Fe-2S)-binding protein [Candidatus Koribacter versatilis]ABF40932.1 (2Fe-2S)-binding protein [Candidatus Koribacter versatilis Ellin345]